MAAPSAQGGRARVLTRALAKSLGQSLVLLVATWAASKLAGPVVGSLVMLIGSFALMAQTFRKEWRLGWLTSLLPPIAAAASYLAQVSLMDDAGVHPPEALILPVVAIGAVVGLLRGRAHTVFARGRAIFAQRTTGYLLLWLVGFGASQVFAFARQRGLAEYGLLSGAFTSATLLVVAIVLLWKRQRQMAMLAAGAMIAAAIVVTPRGTTAQSRLGICAYAPVVPDLVANAGHPLLQGVTLRCQLASTHDSRGRYSLTIWAYRSVVEARSAFEQQRSPQTSAQPIALGDEAFDYVLSNGQWGRVAIVGPYVVTALASAGIANESAGIHQQTVLNIQAAGAPVPAELAALTPAGNVPGAPVLPPGMVFTDNFDREALQEAWWDPLLPQPAVSFMDDFGNHRMGRAAIAANVIASIAMILTCVGLTVPQMTEDENLRTVPPLPKRYVDPAEMLGVDLEPLIDWDGERVPIQDGSGALEGGRVGQVWYDAQWMDRGRAKSLIAERVRERDAELEGKKAQSQDFMADERVKAEMLAKRAAQDQRIAHEAAERAAAEHSRAEARDRGAGVMLHRLADGEFDAETREEALRLAADNNFEALTDLYKSRMGGFLAEQSSEYASAMAWARIHQMGELGAKGVLVFSKAALMSTGVPLVGAPGILGVVGVMGAAGEGTESYLAGDGAGRILAKTAAGFVSGVKDGAITLITNNPGTSAAVRVLLPAGADAAEMYARTGDAAAAGKAAGLSVVSSLVGEKIDGALVGSQKELARTVLSTTMGGATSMARGGSFGEGAVEGFLMHKAAGAGSRVAGWHQSRPDYTHDEDIQQTLTAKKPKGPEPEIIKQLKETLHEAAIIGEDGKPVMNPDGTPATRPMVNARKAMEQLADPASSRWVKDDPPNATPAQKAELKKLREAILNTREHAIYGPANQKTLERIEGDLQSKGELEPGDKLVMKGFSTPGKPASVGADRDARGLIERQRAGRGTVQLEVDHHQWEDDAYMDFYKHTRGLFPEVTPQTHPGFYKRIEELSYLKGAGFSDEQIRARAWAEEHNQLFTSATHLEASRDNQDQSVRIVRTDHGVEIEKTQVPSNVLAVRAGRAPLMDPQGAAEMWSEKPRIYVDSHPAEAVAQTQKGIEALLGVRAGYLKDGKLPPAINDDMAAAMKLVAAAPTDTAATPQVMQKLEQDLQKLGFHDLNSALQAIGQEHDALRFSKPRTFDPGTLSSTDFTRLATQGIAPLPARIPR